MQMLSNVGSQLLKERLSVKILNSDSPKNKSTNAMLPSKNLLDLPWPLLAKVLLEPQIPFAVIGLNAIQTTPHPIHILHMDLTTLLTHIPDHLILLTSILPTDHTLLTLTQLLHLQQSSTIFQNVLLFAVNVVIVIS